VRVSRAGALPYGDALNASIRHLKQFVASDSETLRSLEAGIGNRTRPYFFGDSTNNILLRMVMLKNWSLFTFGRERGHGSAKPPNPPSQAICDFAIHERSQLQFHEHQLRDPEPSSHHTLPYFFPACRLLHWILNWPRQARWYLSLAGWSSEFLVLPTCAVPLALGRQYLFGARLLSVLQETSHVAAIHSEAPTPLENLTGCIKVRLRNIEGSTEVLALPDKGSIRNVVSLALA